MPAAEAATRIVVFLSEDDRAGHRGLHEVIVRRAREEGMAGASVFRGIEGFGGSGKIRTSRFPDAAAGLPVAIELVDVPEKIDAFLEVVHELAPGSLVTRELVTVTRLTKRPASSVDDPAPYAGP